MEIKKFDYQYKTEVKAAYIIRLLNNHISENMSARCAKTCETVGMPYEFFDAIDGTSGDITNLPDKEILKLIKLVNKTLTTAEVACFLSHFLLWVKCVEEDQPIVILEHDAVMAQAYLNHNFFNVVAYLGSIEQANGWPLQFPLPPHGQLNENFRFILRAHAYAIDPMVARQLVAKTIKDGIYTSADVIFRADQFAIIQPGFFAHDLPGETTIPGRPERLSDQHQIDLNNKIQF